MSFLKRFFTKKNPLSSRGNNGVPYSEMEGRNPMLGNDPEKLAQKLIEGYKKHNTNIFETTIPSLRNYIKKNPSLAKDFLYSRFNRRHSDLSTVSDEDIEDMKYQLTRNNINGGRRRKTRRNRRRTRTNRR